MDTTRIHRAISADGTQIAGRVVGQGPPLVLVHGALYDGDTAWSEMLPHLVDDFTCFLPSTRGKGLSAGSTDLRRYPHVQDVTAFVDSIGEPVSLAGWSGGGMFALGAAAHTDAIAALIAYEPMVVEVLTEEEQAAMADTVGRMGAAVEQGRFVDAVEIFAGLVADEEEQQAARAAGRYALAAPNMPVDVGILGSLGDAGGPSATDPTLLPRITAPVLLLQGDRTPWDVFGRGIRELAGHLADSEVRTVAGAGHSAPGVMPEAIAEEFRSFLASKLPVGAAR